MNNRLNSLLVKFGTSLLITLNFMLLGCGGGATPPVSLSSIVITPPTAIISQGQSIHLSATAIYSDGQSADITNQAVWVSANENVVDLSNATGVAVGVEVGITTAAASFGGITSQNSHLTVTPAVLLGISVSPIAISTAQGNPVKFTATGRYADGSTGNVSGSVIWLAENTAVATLTPSGIAFPLGLGSTTVTAQANGITSNDANLTVYAANHNAVKWGVSNGTVTAFAVVNGIRTTVLNSTTTDAQGNYSLSIGNYSGLVLLRLSGGTYLDGATMQRVSLASPLWSALDSPLSTISTNITPLSDAMVILAAELPGGVNSANIATAANVILNKISIDPRFASPVDTLSPSSSTADNAEKIYGIYLGAIFQHHKDHPGKKLLDTITVFADALNDSSPLDTPEIKKSIDNFLASPNNNTGTSLASDLENLSVSLGGAQSSPVPVAIPNVIHITQIENAKTTAQGVTSAWNLNNAALNHEIEGYASSASINRGESIDLYVNTIDPTYTISIYRIGWYGGYGGRLVAGPISLPGSVQPVCPMDVATGLIECNWIRSYKLTVPDNMSDPTDWASGYYLAKLTGSSGKQQQIIFLVRDDNHTSDFLFQASITTYQAYNNWGGKSLYTYNSNGGKAAYKVSFDRPYAGGNGVGQLANYEIHLARFMEKEGYDVSYTTNIDTHVAGFRLINHKAFLSVGHDEYWTKRMRANIEAARDAGINLGFFGANMGYWQVHFEPDSISRPNRTIVAYKLGAPTLDPTYAIHPELSSMLFRSVQINNPEAALIGVMYDYNPVNMDMVINDCSSYICSGTTLVKGSALPYMLGYEVDRLDISSPAGIQIIANSPYNVCLNPPTCSAMQTRYSSATRYQASSGAEVFATGSMQWNWGVSTIAKYANPNVQQMTRNVLNHFIGK